VLVHYNGVDPTYFEHDSDWSLDEATVSELQQEFVVAYVGTLGRAHGLSVALDAAEQLDDVMFLFVGTGAEEETLRREVKRREIENVRFEGRHPKEHVPDFLSLSDLALVHLKDKDLFRTAIPSKTFEAMAAGLPVLMGVRGTATNIVERSDTGLSFQPENPTDLTTVIRELRDDDERRATMGTNGETFVDAEFSWDQIAESYARDLEALVAS
jgi:glycosyltransferase involved in cell wall biosynthesis